MKTLVALFIVGLLAAAMWLQSSAGSRAGTASVDTNTQLPPSEAAAPGDLFRIASSSDFIAVGTVTSIKAVIERLSEQKYKEAADDLSKVDGGMLYTFQVEKLVCAQTDFKPGVKRPQMEGKTFFIFHPLNEPIDSYRGMDEPVSRREQYQEKQRYLLFLTTRPKQKELTKKYTLDGEQTYYTAFEGKKGLIPLPTDDLPLLDNLTEFCQAISPADAQQKIDRLNVLMQSANHELRQSAEEAVQAVKQNILQRN